MEWPLAHECGVLYIFCFCFELTNRFGHALMTMEFRKATGATERTGKFDLPPKWTYGTSSSFRKTFDTLPPMAPERAKFVDCVGQWMKGLHKQAERDPQRSVYLSFQKARLASSYAQYNEQPLLNKLEDLKSRAETWCWETWGQHQLSWKDRSTLDSSEEDYRDYCLEKNMLADNYIVKWRK
jgi:hypothetical protein